MSDKARKIIVIVLIAAACVAAALGISGYVREKNAGSTYQGLRQEVESSVSEDADSAENAAVLTESGPETLAVSSEAASDSVDTSSASTSGTKEDIPIDFAELRKKAPDAYAWIRIPDTNIDYPIVQSPDDNSYYLTHTAEKEEKFEGAIFTENYNSKDFTDPVTVIYGHNMKNQSMFETLHKFEDRTFFKDHPEFVIYTPDKVLHYRVFAAYTYDNRHLLLSFDFSDKTVYSDYLKNIFQMKNMSANIDDSVKVTEEDKIVTLSTCTGDHSTRFLVQAVLENP